MTLKKNKTLAARLTALALTLSLGLIPAQAKKTTYLDVADEAWYSTPIAFCQQHLLMDGASRTDFEPRETLTRAALAEALYRLEGSPAVEETAEAPFSDVGPEHPNLAAIRWAKAAGVINGYPDGAFRPEGAITREEIAVLLWNNREKQAPASAAPYADREAVSDWAWDAVDWAYGAGVMQGTPEKYFYPQDNTSRAEGAAIVMNCARAYYGLEYGYALPEPRTVPANDCDNERYTLDENGYLSYEGAYYARGIDVSAYQEEIDWERVAAAGMKFAMIRSGYRGYTRGTIQKDPYFDANMSGALASGMEVGVYFFSQALTPAEGEEEARQVLEWIKDYEVTYPIVFDWEETKRDDSRSKDTDGSTVTACALAFCRVIREAGYVPMTYGSPNKVYAGGLALEYLQEYPAYWLAHYTKNTAPTSFRYRYDIWQYSCTGRVDGIKGDVDLDICLTDWSGGGQTGETDQEDLSA